jgi:hypothetical protein
MRQYLEGYRFVVITDHQALTWLERIDNPSGRLARWAIELSQWDYEVKYRKGSENILADALSRVKYGTATVDLGCAWYSGKRREVKKNPEQNKDYKVWNNRLCRRVITSLDHQDDDQWKVCVPRDERARVLKETHDAPTAGHLGIVQPGMYAAVTAARQPKPFSKPRPDKCWQRTSRSHGRWCPSTW